MARWWIPVEAVLLRDLRKYRRCPGVAVASVVLPILQLLVIGYAIGGRMQDVPVAIVDLDGGPIAWKIRESLLAGQAASSAFTIRDMKSGEAAARATAEGRITAAIVIPEDYTRRLLQGQEAALTILTDNTDPITSAALRMELAAAASPSGLGDPLPRQGIGQVVNAVPLFPHVEYFDYLAPGTIALGILFACVVGGGMICVDDKWSGISAGYLSTPVTAWQMVAGMHIAGVLKSFLTGIAVTLCAMGITGLWRRMEVQTAIALLLFLGLVSVTIAAITCLISVRLNHPLMARVFFAACAGSLYIPSGALYPVSGFPEWLQVWSWFNPFTYCVHGIRTLLLKGLVWDGLWRDAAVLGFVAAAAILACGAIYPRRLQ